MARKERILIVDDDPEIRRQLRWALADRFDISVAGDPDEARAIMLEAGSLAAAIIDLHLPPDTSTIEGGLSLIRSVRDTGATTRIVVLSADATDEARHRSIRAGAVTFLDKPVDRSKVLKALKP